MSDDKLLKLNLSLIKYVVLCWYWIYQLFDAMVSIKKKKKGFNWCFKHGRMIGLNCDLFEKNYNSSAYVTSVWYFKWYLNNYIYYKHTKRYCSIMQSKQVEL